MPDKLYTTVMCAECVLIRVDGTQEVVTLETHSDAHKHLGGDAREAFALSSDGAVAAVLMRKDQTCGGRNAVAEAIHEHYMRSDIRIFGPVLCVGVNRKTGAIETLPIDWKTPLTEWGARR